MPASRKTWTAASVPSFSEPGSLGGDPLPGPAAHGRGRLRLVDPGAALVAIDPDRREVADPSDAGPVEGGAEPGEERIALPIRRGGDQESVGASDVIDHGTLRRAVQGMHPNARSRHPRGRLGRPHRSGDIREQIPRPVDERAGRVAEAEGEEPHARLMAMRFQSSAIQGLPPFGADIRVGFPPEAQGRVMRHGRRREPRHGPDRHRADKRRGIVQQAHSLRGKTRIPGIADGDQHVAHEPVAARALDRRAGEAGCGKPASSSRRVRPAAGASRSSRAAQLRLAPGLGELVPGADGEAIVAAEDAVADRRRAIPRAIWPLCSIVR